MAQPVKTQALAAYIDSRKMRFAGSLVTLQRLAQMLAIPLDAIAGATIDEATLGHVARYLKLSVDDLRMQTAAQSPPALAPVPAPRAPTPPGVPVVPMPQSVSETAVMPREQLTDLVAKTRRSEPVIAPSPAPVATTAAPDDHEVTITVDEIESLPSADEPPAAESSAPLAAESSTPPPAEFKSDAKSDAKSGKSKKSKSKSK